MERCPRSTCPYRSPRPAGRLAPCRPRQVVTVRRVLEVDPSTALVAAVSRAQPALVKHPALHWRSTLTMRSSSRSRCRQSAGRPLSRGGEVVRIGLPAGVALAASRHPSTLTGSATAGSSCSLYLSSAVRSARRRGRPFVSSALRSALDAHIHQEVYQPTADLRLGGRHAACAPRRAVPAPQPLDQSDRYLLRDRPRCLAVVASVDQARVCPTRHFGLAVITALAPTIRGPGAVSAAQPISPTTDLRPLPEELAPLHRHLVTPAPRSVAHRARRTSSSDHASIGVDNLTCRRRLAPATHAPTTSRHDRALALRPSRVVVPTSRTDRSNWRVVIGLLLPQNDTTYRCLPVRRTGHHSTLAPRRGPRAAFLSARWSSADYGQLCTALVPAACRHLTCSPHPSPPTLPDAYPRRLVRRLS